MGLRTLSWEDPLEEGMATHSRILAWKIPRTEEPGELQSMGLQMTERHLLYFLLWPIQFGNSCPSILGNALEVVFFLIGK